MERPKYLEYRHRRDQIARFTVTRNVIVTLERPALALLRMVGKKTSAKRDTYEESWTMELRTSDVRPDYSALVKTQVTEAKRTSKGEEMPYETGADPTTEFLNETVDQFGGLTEHHGTLPTPHIVLFPDEPQVTGGEWSRSRVEQVPLINAQGRLTGHGPMTVTYRGRIDSFGEEDGVEYADISLSGLGQLGDENDPAWQTFQVGGTVRFALRDGYMMGAEVTRSHAAHLEEKQVLTTTTQEVFQHLSQGREQSVGGMRL